MLYIYIYRYIIQIAYEHENAWRLETRASTIMKCTSGDETKCSKRKGKTHRLSI